MNHLTPRRCLGLGAVLAMGAALAFLDLVPDDTDPPPVSGPAQDYVLAITWHPAHCEIRPRSADCRNGTDDSSATQFSLHGLWPQPYGNFYCGVPDRIVELDKSGAWSRLPPLEISTGLRRDLERRMPGMQSFLHRHEWVKHGTCYGADEETYFRHSLDLMEAVNESAIRADFVGTTGSHLSARSIRASFDQAFGPGAGARVRLACADDNGRKLITELRVHFAAAHTAYEGSFEFGDWMRAANRVGADCPGGIVDRPGPD